MSRARIWQDGSRVKLWMSPDLWWTDRQTRRTFFSAGGMLHELLADGSSLQVCDRLAHSGTCLSATPDSLLRVVRREHAAGRRALAKALRSAR